MTLSEFFSKSPGSLLLISELVLFWTLANYAVVPDPVRQMSRLSADNQPVPKFWTALLLIRSLAMALITFLIAGASTESISLALLLGTAALLLPIARRWWVAPDYGAELEIVASTLAVILIVACVVHWHLVAHRAWTALPFPEPKISALCLIAAIVVFNIRGATYVVRGILNKCWYPAHARARTPRAAAGIARCSSHRCRNRSSDSPRRRTLRRRFRDRCGRLGSRASSATVLSGNLSATPAPAAGRQPRAA